MNPKENKKEIKQVGQTKQIEPCQFLLHHNQMKCNQTRYFIELTKIVDMDIKRLLLIIDIS